MAIRNRHQLEQMCLRNRPPPNNLLFTQKITKLPENDIRRNPVKTPGS